MELNKYQQELFDKQRPTVEKFGAKTWMWSLFFLAWIGLGGYALYLQIAVGHTVTGMRDNVVWGLYIANFIFFIGISYAGAVISGILHILKVEWRKPIIRIAEMITVISTIIGPIFILLCIGRLDRLHHLFLYPRLQSPITWDVFAIGTYFAGSVIFLYLALIKDFAILRDAKLNVPKWKQHLYKFLAIGYRGTKGQNRHINISTNLMAIMIVPLAIIVHSVLSWIFGMTLRPGWHSTIFGPYFVLAAIYSGTGVLIMAMWVYRKMYKLYDYITDQHFVYLGYIMMVLGAGYGYFTFSEYLTDWFASEKWVSEVLEKMFNPAKYGWYFLYSNVFGILIPVLVVAIPFTRKPGIIALASTFMVLALWIKRYLIIVPTLESPLLPMQDTRMEYVKYSATWVEWALTLAGVATFFLFFTIMSKIVPIVPISEFGDKEKNPEAPTDATKENNSNPV
ncbi:MAG: polysulfide reductase NrfD [bacterium]|nr:polysulfide reductase NrfD [bacterium]